MSTLSDSSTATQSLCSGSDTNDVDALCLSVGYTDDMLDQMYLHNGDVLSKLLDPPTCTPSAISRVSLASPVSPVSQASSQSSMMSADLQYQCRARWRELLQIYGGIDIPRDVIEHEARVWGLSPTQVRARIRYSRNAALQPPIAKRNRNTHHDRHQQEEQRLQQKVTQQIDSVTGTHCASGAEIAATIDERFWRAFVLRHQPEVHPDMIALLVERLHMSNSEVMQHIDEAVRALRDEMYPECCRAVVRTHKSHIPMYVACKMSAFYEVNTQAVLEDLRREARAMNLPHVTFAPDCSRVRNEYIKIRMPL
jgi:hypothetical protein